MTSSSGSESVLPDSVQWPAIVKIDNDPELAYVQTAADCALLLGHCTGRAIVVDSSGTMLATDGSSTELIESAELTRWVREHAAALDQCCVSKIHVRDVADAISLVAQLEEAR